MTTKKDFFNPLADCTEYYLKMSRLAILKYPQYSNSGDIIHLKAIDAELKNRQVIK